MKHTINLLVENTMGCLVRIAGLFSGRGFNIDSISVGSAEESGLSRMTIVTHGEDKVIEQIDKQLNKVVDVIKVTDLTHISFVQRELALIKVHASAEQRPEIIQIVDVFRANIVDITFRSLTIEATGTEDKVDAIISMLRPFGLQEVARTGRVALRREYRDAT